MNTDRGDFERCSNNYFRLLKLYPNNITVDEAVDIFFYGSCLLKAQHAEAFKGILRNYLTDVRQKLLEYQRDRNHKFQQIYPVLEDNNVARKYYEDHSSRGKPLIPRSENDCAQQLERLAAQHRSAVNEKDRQLRHLEQEVQRLEAALKAAATTQSPHHLTAYEKDVQLQMLKQKVQRLEAALNEKDRQLRRLAHAKDKQLRELAMQLNRAQGDLRTVSALLAQTQTAKHASHPQYAPTGGGGTRMRSSGGGVSRIHFTRGPYSRQQC